MGKKQIIEEAKAYLERSHDALDSAKILYKKQKWNQALMVFNQAEKLEETFPDRPTTPSRVYIERCEFFKNNPPGDDWDGVWTLTKK